MEHGMVAVTGAAGQLGRRVVEECLGQGLQVVALDRAVLDDSAVDVVVELRELEAVREALRGCDGVIHLAAYPAPGLVDDAELFANNTQATYTVLAAATALAIRSIVLASSASIYGMAYAPRPLPPAYVPIDEQHPLDVQDTYALTKQVDEHTAAMFARVHPDSSVVALRLQWVATPDQLQDMAARLATDPSEHARNLWSYVEIGDAARACRQALDAKPGFHVANVCGAATLCDVPTEELLRTYHPATEIRQPIPGTTSPWSTIHARRLFGFEPEWSR